MFYSRIILPIFLLISFTSSAIASPFTVEFTGTLGAATEAPYIPGEAIKVSIVMDNGGATANSQTWNAADMQSVTFSINNTPITTTLDISPAGNGGNGYALTVGSFTTDAAGNLTAVPSQWADINGVTQVSSNDPNNGDEMAWGIIDGGGSYVFATQIVAGNDYSAANLRQAILTNQTDIVTAANWTAPALAPPPSITGNAIASTTDTTPTLSGTSNEPDATNVTVTLDSDGSTLCTAVVSGGAWSCTVAPALPVGLHSVTAATASANVTFNVNIVAAGGATAVPTLSEWAMILLIMMLAGVGYIKSRRFN